MTEFLSQRQQKLLQAIINRFIDTAEAVGSLGLLDEYRDFNLSSATVRNEMADLMQQGYLYKKHNSSGRIPTNKGWRFFVENIDEKKLQEPDVKTKEEVKIFLSKIKEERDNLIRHSIGFLSHMSGNASFSLVEGKIFYSGLPEMIDIPEFKEGDLLKRVLTILEDYYKLSELFNRNVPEDDINILIGEETGLSDLEDCTVIFSEIRLNGSRKGYIAVIGPNRMPYYQVIPAVKYISDTVRELLKN